MLEITLLALMLNFSPFAPIAGVTPRITGERGNQVNLLGADPASPILPSLEEETDYWRSIADYEITLVLAQLGEFDRALARAQKLDFLQADTLGEIATNLADAGQIDRALTVSRSLDLSYREDSVIAIATQYILANNNEQAIALINELIPKDDRKDIFYIVFLKLTKNKAYSQALNFSQNFPPELQNIAHSFLATTLATAGEIGQATQIADHLFGIRQIYTLIAIAEQEYRTGQKNQAEITIDRVLQLGSTLEPSQQKTMISHLAVSFAEMEQVDRGLELAQTLEDQELRTGTIGAIVSSLIRALIRAGAVDRALDLLKTIPQYPTYEALLGVAIEKLSEMGEWEKAISLARQHKGLLQPFKALGNIAVSMSQAGQSAAAHKILQEALDLVQSTDNIYQKRWDLIYLAGRAAQADWPQLTLQLAQDLARNRENNSNLRELVRDLASNQEYETAFRVAELAKEPNLKAALLSTIAKELVKGKEQERARALVEEISQIISE